ncbi:hypothetical protein [Geodermatophilus sp. SYSU D01119]
MTATVAVISAGLHVLTLIGHPEGSPARLLVLVVMGMACLPCALHLVLLPRRRTWVQMAVVSAAMGGVHPLLAGGHGAAQHGGTPDAVGAAMTVIAAVGLASATWGLVLDGRATLDLRPVGDPA